MVAATFLESVYGSVSVDVGPEQCKFERPRGELGSSRATPEPWAWGWAPLH